MSDPSPIVDLRVKNPIRIDRQRSGRTGSRLGRRGGPGAAAACARKAAAVSLKHHPSETVLQGALECLHEIRSRRNERRRSRLRGISELHPTRSAAAAARLVDTGEKLAHLIDALTAVVDAVEPRIKSSMAGDLSAARALAAAARRIQAGNEAEAQAYGPAQT